MWRTQDFNYTLPEHLIAHAPLERGESRLMVIQRQTGEITHAKISELGQWIPPQSTLVFNDTQVIKARLLGHRKTGGKVEIFLLRHEGNMQWQALLKPQKNLKIGEKISISQDLEVEILNKNAKAGGGHVQLSSPLPMWEAIETAGQVPLPPYIHADANLFHTQYQTVFAQNPGAVAAPTAGLHFSASHLDQLRASGIRTETLTLHVGYGTFRPLSATLLKDHVMHFETYNVNAETAHRLTQTQLDNRPIVAVGTTVVRTLESTWQPDGFRSGAGDTNLFITPGYDFKAIDHLLTNFHLPCSTLLVLVSAFAGNKLIKHAYETAIADGYRFFSFGDAMLIL